MKVSVTVPAIRVLDRKDISKAVAGALYRAAWEICTRSKDEFVPVVMGTLRSSIHAELPNTTFIGDVAATEHQPQMIGATPIGTTIFVEFGAGGPAASYALKVHENPRSGKTGGFSPSGVPYPWNRWSRVGQWKYLEVPFLEIRPQLADRIKRALSRVPRRRT